MKLNERVINLDEKTERIHNSINSVVISDDNGEITATIPEYLQTLSPPSLPPHELRLRQYFIVLLIRNLISTKDYVTVQKF